LPNVGPYIYDVSTSGFTRSSICIYDISSLRVNRHPNQSRDFILWSRFVFVTPLFNLYKQFSNVLCLKLSKYDTVDINYHGEIKKIGGNPLLNGCHGNVDISSGISKNACKFSNEAFHKQRVALLRFWKQTSFRFGCAHTSGTGFRQFRQVTTPEFVQPRTLHKPCFRFLRPK